MWRGFDELALPTFIGLEDIPQCRRYVQDTFSNACSIKGLFRKDLSLVLTPFHGVVNSQLHV